jgi:hypothetical protein
MLQIGGMALELTADLEPITEEHGPQLGDELLSGIAGLAKGSAEIALEARGMAGGMDLACLTAPHEVVFSVGDRQAIPLLLFCEVGLLGQASFDGAIQIQCMNSTL